MSTVKLFSQNKRTIGITCTIPVVGEVTFDPNDNSIEVESDKVDELRQQDFGTVLLTKDELESKKSEESNLQKK